MDQWFARSRQLGPRHPAAPRANPAIFDRHSPENCPVCTSASCALARRERIFFKG